MPNSVQIHDYFDNDENGLWSWYLTNLRSGNFEELINNKLKDSLLKRFLRNQVDINDQIKKILLISIPDHIFSDINVLEIFLSDYFHLNDLSNIKIIKLTKFNVYNHENHYLLIDSVNNFKDETFLNYVNPQPSTNASNKFIPSIRTGTSASIPENDIPLAPIRNIDSSISIECEHEEYDSSYSCSSSSDIFSVHNNNNNNNNNDGNDNNDILYEGTEFHENDNADYETYSEDYFDDDSEFQNYSISESNCSILPCVSINNEAIGHYRLVLQSMLICNKENLDLQTGVRQSNNLINYANINDDWMLYDEKFSMRNLNILSLKDLSIIGNVDSIKILFYSMIDVNNQRSTTQHLQLTFQDDLKIAKTTSNGHRSIRTIITDGETIYKRKNKNKLKLNRFESMSSTSLERWKSLPLKLVETDVKKWKRKISLFKKRKSNSHHHNHNQHQDSDSFCNIM
ncbi:hypothetical protein KAFR_0C05390 [Kazachstania africana CBS 2517]|uniref:Protein GIS4 n=1 Tax=Kazachstania africana (strain ATCC 22294 / BCRC 22015 / CBS 2517 / CECT 1963 / NBRC 1671 / NRRL Y-8276) TaxID=1071382 RepID=H2AT30_KAZAF|nr:hypothetical protein KAFR_0C05390 [Kazachstania africana CBS 2517]CCF57530.1 hypothetical protein KAFR_0C05390 [Kazachstania africana CBS 2517]